MKRTALFALAFALPPREVVRTYDWAKDLRGLAQVKARVITNLLPDPVLHGGLVFDGKKSQLKVLSPDGTRVAEYVVRPGGLSDRRERLVTDPEAEKIFWKDEPASAVFEWTGKQIDYRPERGGRVIWSVPLPLELTGQEWSSETRSWVGWVVSPRTLFVLPDPYRNFYKLSWTSEGEPVRFFACDRSRLVLVENLSNGLSRFFYFRDGEPIGYTIFDFAQGTRRAEITAVRSSGCTDFFVAGSFGVTRVQYTRW